MSFLLPTSNSSATSRGASKRRSKAASGSILRKAVGSRPSPARVNGSAATSTDRRLFAVAGLATWTARLPRLKDPTLSPVRPAFLAGCSAVGSAGGDRWLDGVHSIDFRRVESFFKNLPKTPLPAKVEYRLARADGPPVWVRHWVLELDADGTVYGGLQEVGELKSAHAENLDVSEREQNRIGQDLHDDLCQVLAGLSCLTRVVERQVSEKSPEAAKALNEINQQLVEAMERTRALTHGLFPARLKNGDVRGALQELSVQIKARFKVDIHLAFRGAFPQHDHLQIIQVYRLAQEAISNSVKHGRAQNVHLDLRRDGERMALSIQDDGSGFPEVHHNKEGIGLHIMRHRAALLGGELSIGNAPRGGARVALTYSTPSTHEKS